MSRGVSNGIPADAMIEMRVEDIDEGGLIRQMNASIKEAMAVLVARRKRGEAKGEATITAQVRMGFDPKIENHVAIVHVVTMKTPKNERTSLVKEVAGRLLCQPGGANKDTPDQLALFSPRGVPIGRMDTATGELVDEPTVVGAVGKR